MTRTTRALQLASVLLFAVHAGGQESGVKPPVRRAARANVPITLRVMAVLTLHGMMVLTRSVRSTLVN